jgi:hypothetical protein
MRSQDSNPYLLFYPTSGFSIKRVKFYHRLDLEATCHLNFIPSWLPLPLSPRNLFPFLLTVTFYDPKYGCHHFSDHLEKTNRFVQCPYHSRQLQRRQINSKSRAHQLAKTNRKWLFSPSTSRALTIIKQR